MDPAIDIGLCFRRGELRSFSRRQRRVAQCCLDSRCAIRRLQLRGPLGATQIRRIMGDGGHFA
jgi:hypothetical protein